MFRSSLRRGFTLVELMIVIGIIGILSATLYPSLTAYLQRGRDTATQKNIITVATKISEYLQDKGSIYGMTTGTPTWYCIQLGSGSTASCSVTNGLGFTWGQLPLPEIDRFTQFTIKDFTIQKIGFQNPLLMKIAPGDTIEHASRLFAGSMNTTDRYQYVLHWSLPGLSDGPPGITTAEGCLYSGGVVDCSTKYNISIADKRCAPGIARQTYWDNVQETTCHMLITY